MSDKNFLVRAALHYGKEGILDNQTEMFQYVWSLLSEAEQNDARSIWKKDQLEQPVMENSLIPKAAINLIKEFEGLHLKAYADPLHGWNVPSIGFGTTKYINGTPVRKGDVITEQEAEDNLSHFLKTKCLPSLKRIPTWQQMNSNQQSAIYSFAYNLGPHFYNSRGFRTISSFLNDRSEWTNRNRVIYVFCLYRNPGTNVEAGLKRRRTREAELFLS